MERPGLPILPAGARSLSACGECGARGYDLGYHIRAPLKEEACPSVRYCQLGADDLLPGSTPVSNPTPATQVKGYGVSDVLHVDAMPISNGPAARTAGYQLVDLGRSLWREQSRSNGAQTSFGRNPLSGRGRISKQRYQLSGSAHKAVQLQGTVR